MFANIAPTLDTIYAKIFVFARAQKLSRIAMECFSKKLTTKLGAYIRMFIFLLFYAFILHEDSH